MVGDLAETIALILPPAVVGEDHGKSLSDLMTDLSALAGQTADPRKAAILQAWSTLGTTERLLFNKLITGGFRMGVSQGLMTRALAQATGVDEAVLAHRLMGDWTPQSTSFAALVSDSAEGPGSRPIPLPSPRLWRMDQRRWGAPGDWRAEWKWDGIRGQLVHRPDAFALWSRGEDLVTDRFPEFAALADFLPQGTVIDGEVLAWDQAQSRPLPFADLQTRIGRTTVPKTVLAKAPRGCWPMICWNWADRTCAPSPLPNGGQSWRR